MGIPNSVGGTARIATVGSFLLCCCAAPRTTVAHPEPAPGAAAAKEDGRAGASGDRTCASLRPYGLVAGWIASHPSFGPTQVVLLRPSAESKRIDEGAAMLARADSDVASGSPKLQELSGLLHAELESLRRLLSALDQRDDGAYLTEAARFEERKTRVIAIGRERDAECRTSVFRSWGILPPTVIQKRVREHYEEFRHCYEAGLARNPKLEGKVTVRFVIDRTGHMAEIRAVHDTSSPESEPEAGTEEFFAKLGLHAHTTGSDPATTLPDPEAIACLVDRYRPIVFPPPEGGIVTVVYPIIFSPKQEAQ